MAREALHAGASSYLLKNVSIDELANVIRRVVETHDHPPPLSTSEEILGLTQLRKKPFWKLGFSPKSLHNSSNLASNSFQEGKLRKS